MNNELAASIHTSILEPDDRHLRVPLHVACYAFHADSMSSSNPKGKTTMDAVRASICWEACRCSRGFIGLEGLIRLEKIAQNKDVLLAPKARILYNPSSLLDMLFLHLSSEDSKMVSA